VRCGRYYSTTKLLQQALYNLLAACTVLDLSTASALSKCESCKHPNARPLLQDPIFKGNKVPNPEMGYPGGIFDPLGFSKGNLKELQTKEIKNGRIAMVAYMAFVIQVSENRGRSRT